MAEVPGFEPESQRSERRVLPIRRLLNMAEDGLLENHTLRYPSLSKRAWLLVSSSSIWLAK